MVSLSKLRGSLNWLVPVHAVAGGLGGLVCQMAKHLGAKVIGTTSTEEKAKYAIEECGCDEVILYTQKDFEEEAKRLTNGKGVNVVYDSVSRKTSHNKKGF